MRQKRDLPWPFKLRSQPLEDVDAYELERAVKSTTLIDRSWTTTRQYSPTKFTSHLGDQVLGYEVLMDRWLLCVFSEGSAYMWDLQADISSRVSLVAELQQHTRWTSFATSFQRDTGARSASYILTMAVNQEHPARTTVYTISFPRPSKYETLSHVDMREWPASLLRDADPSRELLVFSRTSVIELIKQDSRSAAGNEHTRIITEDDDVSQMFTTILALRLLSNYIFVFKTRSIELYPLPDYLQRQPRRAGQLPTLKHQLKSCTFRTVMLSDPRYEGDKVSLNCLAYNVMLGLFYYSVTLSLPESDSSLLPSLDVRLVGIYPMAGDVEVFPLSSLDNLSYKDTEGEDDEEEGEDDPATHDLPGDETPTPAATRIADYTILTPESVLKFHHSRSTSSHAFVSSLALGKQARRAVWVERSRGSMVWEVVVCTLPPLDYTGTVKLDGKVVHSVLSYDLRDGWTSCALNEATGLIILGSRLGDVFLLDNA